MASLFLYTLTNKVTVMSKVMTFIILTAFICIVLVSMYTSNMFTYSYPEKIIKGKMSDVIQTSENDFGKNLQFK